MKGPTKLSRRRTKQHVVVQVGITGSIDAVGKGHCSRQRRRFLMKLTTFGEANGESPLFDVGHHVVDRFVVQCDQSLLYLVCTNGEQR